MPDWMRSVSASEKKAEAAVRFCEAVRDAVTPYKVPSLYLFDADEKKAPLREAIGEATEGRARFLPVRELENLFLWPTVIHQVLAGLCSQVGAAPPSVDEIANEIDRLLDDTNNRQIYKSDPGQRDPMKVVGSEVLGQLWWKWATATYDKVAYGPELMKAMIECEPASLDLLRSLLRELDATVRANRAKV